MKIAFIVGSFPKVSETFIIDQICDLIDRGIEVDIYSFQPGQEDKSTISRRYFAYGLDKRTQYISRGSALVFKLLPKLWRWNITPFRNKEYSLYHCHFGNVGVEFVKIHEVLKLDGKIVTSLYGRDVSAWIKQKGIDVYKGLISACSVFFVMSENMKERVVAQGFPPEKVIVHPTGVDVAKYHYSERKVDAGSQINIVSVGRFVEKKGFDDLLRALAIVRQKVTRNFKCYIIGDGPLRDEIHSLSKTLKLNDVVEFKGSMAIDKIIEFFKTMHFFVQPSKTAKDGDME